MLRMKTANPDSTALLFRQKLTHRCMGGFSLIELMLVVVIVSILAAVALPAYQKMVAKSRRADAINALASVLQAQERWRSNRGSYASSLADDELKLGGQSEGKHYNLSLTGIRVPASFAFGFIATATADSSSPQFKDSQCFRMSVRVEGGNVFYEAKDDAAAPIDTSSKCWPK